MNAPAETAIPTELRAAVGSGFPVPPNLSSIAQKMEGYRNESKLHEFRVIPSFTGTYAEVMVQACRRNAELMPYEDTDKIPVRFYPHPTLPARPAE